MTASPQMDIYAAEGDSILDWANNFMTQLLELIPTAMQVGGFLLVLIVIFVTRSAVKAITTALVVSVLLTLTGNMPVLSEMFGNELGAPAAPGQPSAPPATPLVQ